MADIIDEIKDDIKDERYAELWKKYGNIVIGLAFIVVAGTAGAVWWKSYQLGVNESRGDQLFAAAQLEAGGNNADAISAYDAISFDSSSFAQTIALLRKAALLAQQDSVDQAVEIYDRLTSESQAPEEFKELAELLYLYNVASSKDDNNNESFTKRLDKLTQNSGPWKYSAMELSAFYSLDKGDREQAKKIFQDLRDELKAPSRIRNRAMEMIDALSS